MLYNELQSYVSLIIGLLVRGQCAAQTNCCLFKRHTSDTPTTRASYGLAIHILN